MLDLPERGAPFRMMTLPQPYFLFNHFSCLDYGRRAYALNLV